MKFYLIFSTILLLVPLAFAHLPSSLTSKLLYDGGFAIGENIDGRYTQISYYGPNESKTTGFYYSFKNNVSESDDWVAMKQEFSKESLSFALETWPHNKDKSDGVQCVQKSEESLRGLIGRGCWGRIKLRSLTEQEKQEVQKFKEEYRATGKPFTIIHDDKQIKIKTIALNMFYYDDSIFQHRFHNLQIYSSNGDVRKNMMIQDEMKEKRFVVEALPESSYVDCMNIGVKVDRWGCNGKIQLRHLFEKDRQ